MEARGVDDQEMWTELRACREEIDALAQEKLLLVAKLYNLAQRFVMELDVATDETSKQIAQSSNTVGRNTGTSQYEHMLNQMRSSADSAQNAGKQFADEIMGS